MKRISSSRGRHLMIYISVFLLVSQFAFATEVTLTASDLEGRSNFGNSVSISGDYAIVGAKDLGSGSTGAAYIFVRNGSNWTQQVKLVSSDLADSDYLGYSVSISGDYAIVGAPGEDEDATGANNLSRAGSAYIFYRNEGGSDNWGQQAKIVPSDRAFSDDFGEAVSISGDYVLVGARDQNFDAAGANEVANAGAAYIFSRSGTIWSQDIKLVAEHRNVNDYFGMYLSLSGDYAIVSSVSGDLDASGANSLSEAGSAYIFYRDQGGVDNWGQQEKIVASDRAASDVFGKSVSISGDYAIVGAYLEDEDVAGSNTLAQAGSAYIFIRSGTSWSQQAKIVASDRESTDYFGTSVSISGDYAFVGAPFEDGDTTDNGMAYSFLRSGTNWTQTSSKNGPSNSGSEDYFGSSVALSSSYAISGAYNYGETNRYGAAFIYQTGSDLSLPVELSLFTAHALRSSVVELAWSTESETENLGFILERASTGSATGNGGWTEIASYITHPGLQGHGSTTEAHTYSFTDQTVVTGESYDYRLADVSYSGKKVYHGLSVVGVQVNAALPKDFALTGAYPNPFNPRTRIGYSLPEAAEMHLSIYDMKGQLVTIIKSGLEPAGSHHVYWKGKDSNGRRVGSGVYVCQFQVEGQQVETLKLVYLK